MAVEHKCMLSSYHTILFVIYNFNAAEAAVFLAVFTSKSTTDYKTLKCNSYHCNDNDNNTRN